MIPKTANISIVSEDPVFINLLKLFGSRLDIKFNYYSGAFKSTPADLYIIDACNLGTFLAEGSYAAETKIIAHGRSEDLKPSFDAGCKDFLREPWNIDELEIRISNILSPLVPAIKWSNLTLTHNTLVSGKSSVPLSIEENAILKMLILNKGEPVPREALLFALWGKFNRNSRAVDMHISSLRSKIRSIVDNKESTDCRIKTVRSCGYMID